MYQVGYTKLFFRTGQVRQKPNIYIMIRLTDPFWCTDRPSVWYVPNHTNVLTHGMIGRIDKLICIAHTGPLSNWYVLCVPIGMLRYGEPWFICIELNDANCLFHFILLNVPLFWTVLNIYFCFSIGFGMFQILFLPFSIVCFPF